MLWHGHSIRSPSSNTPISGLMQSNPQRVQWRVIANDTSNQNQWGEWTFFFNSVCASVLSANAFICKGKVRCLRRLALSFACFYVRLHYNVHTITLLKGHPISKQRTRITLLNKKNATENSSIHWNKSLCFESKKTVSIVQIKYFLSEQNSEFNTILCPHVTSFSSHEVGENSSDCLCARMLREWFIAFI